MQKIIEAFSHPITEIITSRCSWRTFGDSVVEDEKIELIQNFIDKLTETPFGSKVRFKIARHEGNISGTYGVIKNAKMFLVGAVKKGLYDMQDFGHAFERLILYATDLGLSTCWLGASFSRKVFGDIICLENDETIPALSPFGYKANSRGLLDTMFRFVARSSTRKNWEELFFYKDFQTPLNRDTAGKYSIIFDMIRQAPSASNKQPWRLVLDNNRIHFYIQRSYFYDKMVQDVDLQRIDMGIAMSHLELTSQNLGIEGSWEIKEPNIEQLPEQTSYIVTWLDKN